MFKAGLGDGAEKSATGYVGLANQGATCYLNSLIQALFFLPEVRELVYSFEYDESKHGAEAQCQVLQLQRLFAHLQLCHLAAVDTSGLTTSFGWTSADVFEQQDVQELFKILLQRLEEALGEGALAAFRGRVTAFVTCAAVGYQSLRSEEVLTHTPSRPRLARTRAHKRTRKHALTYALTHMNMRILKLKAETPSVKKRFDANTKCRS